MSLWPLPFASAAAAALLDGPWTATTMAERLELTFGVRRQWMKQLARATRDAFDEPPAWEVLTAWIDEHEPLPFVLRADLVIRRWSLPAPAMTESPWPVPPLATTKELATWLGLDVAALIALADRRGISRDADAHCRHYRYTWIPKRSGGHRLLEAPKPRLRAVQRAILDGDVHDAESSELAAARVARFASMPIASLTAGSCTQTTVAHLPIATLAMTSRSSTRVAPTDRAGLELRRGR